MVGRDDLPNTIALNQFLTNAARIVGPNYRGPGDRRRPVEAACFLINALSFLPLVVCLASMRNLYRSDLESQELRQSGIFQGIKYVIHTPILRWLLSLAAVSNLLLLAYSPLMPGDHQSVVGRGARRTRDGDDQRLGRRDAWVAVASESRRTPAAAMARYHVVCLTDDHCRLRRRPLAWSWRSSLRSRSVSERPSCRHFHDLSFR